MIWKMRLSCHVLCCWTRYRFLSHLTSEKYIQYMDISINKYNFWLGVSDFSHYQCLCFRCMCVCGCLSFQGQDTTKRGVWWQRSRNHSNMSFVKFKRQEVILGITWPVWQFIGCNINKNTTVDARITMVLLLGIPRDFSNLHPESPPFLPQGVAYLEHCLAVKMESPLYSCCAHFGNLRYSIIALCYLGILRATISKSRSAF